MDIGALDRLPQNVERRSLGVRYKKCRLGSDCADGKISPGEQKCAGQSANYADPDSDRSKVA